MFAFHSTLSFRYLRQRRLRAALVIASIALGVSTMVATRALSQSMQRAAGHAVTPLAGGADLLISNGEHGVRDDLADELRAAAIPGIAEIRPLVIARVVLPDLANRPAVLLGVDLEPGQASNNSWGVETKLTNPLAWRFNKVPVFVGDELARAFPDGIDTLRVRAAGQVSQLAGIGTVDARGPAAMLGGSVLVLRRADAAKLLGKAERATRIDVTLTPDADLADVRQRVLAVVNGLGDVRTPQDNDDAMKNVLAGLELAFLLGGVGALVVGLFLVYNALSVTVAERRHDIGVLRSMGATRGQVAGLFALEAALLGLAGAVLGVPLGLGLAHFSTGPVQAILSDIFLPFEAGGVPVTTESVLIAVIGGIVTALLAAIVPAVRASNQEPADAVRRVPLTSGWRYRLLQVASSGLVIAAGAVCILLRQAMPDALGGTRTGSFGGMALVLVGILMATPLMAEAAAHLLNPIVRTFLSIEGRLAADNLARSPGRTGLVIAALAAGVALMLQTAGLTLSSEEAILHWIDRSIAADLFVSCNSPIAASGNSQPMSESVGTRIAELPEVAAALPVRFQRIDYRDTIAFIIALDAQGFHDMGRTRPGVVGREQYPELCRPNSVLVSENFALQHGVGVGDTVTLRGPRGPFPLRVIGTVLDYTWNRGSLFLDRNRYVEYFEDPLVDSFDIYLRPGVDTEAAREKISRRWGAEEALVVTTRAELRQTVSLMLRRLYALAYAQILVVGLVAALGVVTALLISVLQRRREIGLLRAVGASQVQVLRTVLAEALLMGLVGAAIGLLVGIPLEWYAVRIIMLEETGFSFPVLIPWQAAGVVMVLALAIAALAGLGPALHAMRLRIAEAIAYE